MRFRLYCIFEAPQSRTIHYALACEGVSVQVMKKHNLYAVFSEISGVGGTYDVSKVMQHHKVIEFFFDQVTVVPFRFETVLEDALDLELLLEERGDYYRKILGTLDGCAEMGIRAIVADNTVGTSADHECSPFPSPEASSPGRLYLRNRKVYYADEALLAEKREEVAARIRVPFAGMFRDFRSEASRLQAQGSAPDALLVSLYFLVPKDRVSTFRHKFDAQASKDPSRLLLSGPWPPYNFVLPGDSRLM